MHAGSVDTVTWDVIVVGGSVAGLSAALMLGRSRRRVLVIDAGEPRNRFAEHMHGVLGQDGTVPAQFVATGRDEVAAYGGEFVAGLVERIDEVDGAVVVSVADGAAHRARAVVVATGVSDDLPDVPGLSERWGRSVLHCPYCHGWEVRDQRIGVLATSPQALHQVELVRQLSDRVTLFCAGLESVEPAVERRLRARNVELVRAPVVQILGDANQVTGVRIEGGDVVSVDAIFTAATLRPHDRFLDHLALDRADGPVGSFLAVDATGKTSSDRIWAAGNVTNPMANVPIAMAAGATTGAAVNLALVSADFDAAVAQADPVTPTQFWEERYAGADKVWSGRANSALVDIVANLPVGRALDLGCGEGGDAIWLAEQGWQVTGIDISSTAIARARVAAVEAGVPDERIRFTATDLGAWTGDGASYDLVTACFFHSPVEVPHTEILQRASDLVARDGHLLIVSHADFPPWSSGHNQHEHHDHQFLTPEEEIKELDLDDEWDVRIAETRGRQATGPNGEQARLDDVIVLLRRR